MKNAVSCVLAALLGVVLSGCAGQPAGNGAGSGDTSSDEKAIRALYDRFDKAFHVKDIDGIMATYTPGADLFLFDVIPPRQYVGANAVRKDYEAFFAAFPGPVDKFDIKDLSVVTDGTLAYSHCVSETTVTAKDGSKFSITFRVTDGLRKVDGKWLIAQEHISVPVDLETLKPDLESKP